MTVLIYFVCFAVASLIQTTLSYMLDSGDVAGIPGAFIFYLLAFFVAGAERKSCQGTRPLDKIQKPVDVQAIS